MHFGTKSYLKSNRNHTTKQTLRINHAQKLRGEERKKKRRKRRRIGCQSYLIAPLPSRVTLKGKPRQDNFNV